MMEGKDDPIDRVLAGLGRARPPEGLEARVRARMASARPAAASVERRWRLGRIGAAGWSFAAAGLLTVVLVMVLDRPAHPPVYGDWHAALQTPTATPEIRFRAPLVAARDRPHARPSRLVEIGESAEPTTQPEALDDEEALALAETRAPSLVAPPQPLSDQERLLLRIVHKGDPQELALLNPVMRELWDAQEKAQFHDFFTPKPVAALAGEPLPTDILPTQPVHPQQ